jgi:choline oxidase
MEAGFPFVAFNTSEFREGVGWFQLNKRGLIRQSSSVAYLHPLAKLPPNLTVLTGFVAFRIILNENGRAVGVDTKSGKIGAREEIIVCCGAFDSPKLLLLSGIGPADHLREVGIDVQLDLPGVGENLMDHPEGVVIWEAVKPVPEVSTQFWEAGLFACTEPTLEWPDLMYHFGTVAFDLNTAPLGYPTSTNAFSMTPNVTRPRSRGWVRLRSSDPAAPPVIDFRYFTDPGGHDERVVLAGIKLARKIADQPSLRSWIRRELAPGSAITEDEVLSDYACRTSNTVYHPAGTCRMGRSEDSRAVVDPALRVRGIQSLRVADASIFPEMIGMNPCITCMMIGEKCASLVRAR